MLPSSGKYENTHSYDFERIKGIYEIARGLIFFFFFLILHIVVTYRLLLSTLNMVKLKLKKK